jgi:hypothetical protein
MGFIWALMAVRDEANANGEIALVMDLVGSRNLGLNLDLARAGVKVPPAFRPSFFLPLALFNAVIANSPCRVRDLSFFHFFEVAVVGAGLAFNSHPVFGPVFSPRFSPD